MHRPRHEAKQSMVVEYLQICNSIMAYCVWTLDLLHAYISRRKTVPSCIDRAQIMQARLEMERREQLHLKRTSLSVSGSRIASELALRSPLHAAAVTS